MREFMSLVEQHTRYFGGFAHQPERSLVARYMQGWCPYFALALHDVFGWEFVHTGDHVACKRPDGMYVDIRGIMTAEQFKNGLEYDPYLDSETMTRDEVIADMDTGISFKCGFFYEGDLVKAKKLVRSLLPSTITESADGITFVNEHLNYQHGQHDCILRLKVHGVEKGRISYSVFEGNVAIKMIEVDEKRRGYGTRLMLELQRLFPDQEIDTGGLTDDGAALIGSLPTTTIVDGDLKAAFDRLAELHAKDGELTRRSEAGEKLDLKPNEWNDIHDEIWKLEDHLRGKSATMRLFTAY